jgi:hypothetical protein
MSAQVRPIPILSRKVFLVSMNVDDAVQLLTRQGRVNWPILRPSVDHERAGSGRLHRCSFSHLHPIFILVHDTWARCRARFGV